MVLFHTIHIDTSALYHANRVIFFHYFFTHSTIVKSHDVRGIVISHFENGKKLRKLQNYLQIKFIEVQLIDGYTDTNNLVLLVLNRNQEDQEVAVQTDALISREKDSIPLFLGKVYELWLTTSNVVLERSSEYSTSIYIKNAIKKSPFKSSRKTESQYENHVVNGSERILIDTNWRE